MGKPGKRGRFPKLSKAPKDHVHLAFCLNYCGSAYRGLQIQGHGPTHHTIEGVCVQCMKDIGLIASVDRGRPGGEQHHFARSCRTDRGVHAIRNLLSIFVHNDAFAALGAEKGIRERMNAALPEAIRVAQVTVVAPNFVPRHCCNRRVYRYVIPAYALLPPCDSWQAAVSRFPQLYSSVKALLATGAAHVRTIGETRFVNMGDAMASASSEASWVPWMTELRVCLEKANMTLQEHFVGAHRFHNYSVDAVEFRGQSKVIRPDTDEAVRSIYRCEVADRLFLLPVAADGGVTAREYKANKAVAATSSSPSVTGAVEDEVTAEASAGACPALSRLPFVVFQIEGNSFLFNMIRKVVGTMIAVCRGASTAMVVSSLSPEHRVRTPLAPGSYLYLSLSSYHGYDATIRSLQPGSALHTLQEDWSGSVAQTVEDFAFSAIAEDVVDIDLHRVPPLDDLLLARDAARDVTRPEWREEDSHLETMKEYKPLEESTAQKPAVSEMTLFLRRLRVHNWSVKHLPLPVNSKAMLELKNKRARVEQAQNAAAASGETVTVSKDSGEGGATEVATVHTPAPDDSKAELPATKVDAGEDGWIYVASTEDEERDMRQAQFLARWKRARPWEFNSEELEGDDPGDMGDHDE